MKKLWTILLLLFLVACAENPIPPEDFANQFLNGEFEKLYKQTSDEFQEMVSMKQFQELGEEFNQGVDTYKLDLEMKELGEYQWISNQEDKGIWASFLDDHTITGIQLMPLETFPEQDETFTKNKYRMPVKEEWFVYWGGTNVLNNYHYTLPQQRYAYDLVIVRDGSTYDGDPTENDSYYAFGKDVLAPADGIVVATKSEYKDNKPGIETDVLNPLGNYVIIQHANDEYSILAHLKQDSVTVEEGDRLVAGDLIGKVGNSGNSSEPHIHFQVSDGKEFETSNSIRILFEDNEFPVRGDFIQGF